MKPHTLPVSCILRLTFPCACLCFGLGEQAYGKCWNGCSARKNNNNKLVQKLIKSCANVIVLEERKAKQWENTWGTACWIMAREHTQLKLTRAGILGSLQPVRCHSNSSSSLFTSDFLGEKKMIPPRGRYTTDRYTTWRLAPSFAGWRCRSGPRWKKPPAAGDRWEPTPTPTPQRSWRVPKVHWFTLTLLYIHNRRAMNRLIHEIVLMRRISAGMEKHMYWCSGKEQAIAKFASRIRWRLRRAP